ncbi:hypothetical protein X798_04770 [Onchocerca flexuosa]|uniref:Uncharacterized protein n=1 Tax=Onchocerca flexuosa TaxID=387005 RepID=A0A238BS68_9BILA|nr:hypothetical protein X798_04770 [Onchocerca flexuosa]
MAEWVSSAFLSPIPVLLTHILQYSPLPIHLPPSPPSREICIILSVTVERSTVCFLEFIPSSCFLSRISSLIVHATHHGILPDRARRSRHVLFWERSWLVNVIDRR